MIATSYFFLSHFYKANILIYLHSTFVYRCLWWETVPLPHQPWPPSFPTPSTYLNMINLLQEYTTKTTGKAVYFSSVSLCVIIVLISLPT